MVVDGQPSCDSVGDLELWELKVSRSLWTGDEGLKMGLRNRGIIKATT